MQIRVTGCKSWLMWAMEKDAFEVWGNECLFSARQASGIFIVLFMTWKQFRILPNYVVFQQLVVNYRRMYYCITFFISLTFLMVKTIIQYSFEPASLQFCTSFLKYLYESRLRKKWCVSTFVIAFYVASNHLFKINFPFLAQKSGIFSFHQRLWSRKDKFPCLLNVKFVYWRIN